MAYNKIGRREWFPSVEVNYKIFSFEALLSRRSNLRIEKVYVHALVRTKYFGKLFFICILKTRNKIFSLEASDFRGKSDLKWYINRILVVARLRVYFSNFQTQFSRKWAPLPPPPQAKKLYIKFSARGIVLCPVACLIINVLLFYYVWEQQTVFLSFIPLINHRTYKRYWRNFF